MILNDSLSRSALIQVIACRTMPQVFLHVLSWTNYNSVAKVTDCPCAKCGSESCKQQLSTENDWDFPDCTCGEQRSAKYTDGNPYNS